MTVGQGQHIVVIGPMGVGKTTIGGLLADALVRPFLDSDEVLEDRLGADGAAIAELEGVERLHDLELEVFLQMSRHETPSVIAPAASVVDQPSGREILAQSFTIRLTAPDEVLAVRNEQLGHRRPVDAEEREALRRRRDPYLDRLVDLSFDTGLRTPRQVVEEVVGGLPGIFSG
ncbi:MAG TPA: shikimate kinase [Acidimicrobiia bacterium]|nr:shikimate kinase [Acidimicrobiia bacterium]